jgi:ssDNA-binding Zn-finger/Zn-ribbon topoisomerase 1
MLKNPPSKIGDPCPHCAGRLVTYTIKKGSLAGKNFLICSNAPACSFAHWTQEEKDLPHVYH